MAATPRLTLDLGLRFDYFGNPYPSSALISVISNFRLGSGATFTEQVASGGLKLTSQVYDSTPKTFSPRVDVSWDPTGSHKYVVRDGVGVYHEWFTNGELTVPLRANPPAYANPTFFSTQGIAPVLRLARKPCVPSTTQSLRCLRVCQTPTGATRGFLPRTSAALTKPEDAAHRELHS